MQDSVAGQVKSVEVIHTITKHENSSKVCNMSAATKPKRRERIQILGKALYTY